jgi:hypothetical protein
LDYKVDKGLTVHFSKVPIMIKRSSASVVNSPMKRQQPMGLEKSVSLLMMHSGRKALQAFSFNLITFSGEIPGQ